MRQTITQKVLALVLTIAALAAGQSATAQVGTFTVTNTSGSTFTITRTTNTDATEKVMYRTVSLSAIAGTHFTAASGTLTFDAENNTRTVTVTLSCTGTAPSGYVEPCYYNFDGTNISGSTVTMPASDATVALLWTTDYETGHAGTEADPYIISD